MMTPSKFILRFRIQIYSNFNIRLISLNLVKKLNFNIRLITLKSPIYFKLFLKSLFIEDKTTNSIVQTIFKPTNEMPSIKIKYIMDLNIIMDDY